MSKDYFSYFNPAALFHLARLPSDANNFEHCLRTNSFTFFTGCICRTVLYII
jgi:hypothetical protein